MKNFTKYKRSFCEMRKQKKCQKWLPNFGKLKHSESTLCYQKPFCYQIDPAAFGLNWRDLTKSFPHHKILLTLSYISWLL